MAPLFLRGSAVVSLLFPFPFPFWSRVPPCGLLIQKYLESGDGTPDEDASHERNCFRIRMPKLQPDSVLESTYVSGCTFTVCRLISSVWIAATLHRVSSERNRQRTGLQQQ